MTVQLLPLQILQDQRVPPALRVQKVIWELKEFKDHKVIQELQELKVIQELKDRKVIQELQELKVL